MSMESSQFVWPWVWKVRKEQTFSCRQWVEKVILSFICLLMNVSMSPMATHFSDVHLAIHLMFVETQEVPFPRPLKFMPENNW